MQKYQFRETQIRKCLHACGAPSTCAIAAADVVSVTPITCDTISRRMTSSSPTLPKDTFFFFLSRLVIFLFNFVLFMFKLKTIFILIIWFWCNLICYKFLYVLNINFVVWYYQVFVDYEKYSVLLKYYIINKNVGIKFDYCFGPLEQRSQ